MRAGESPCTLPPPGCGQRPVHGRHLLGALPLIRLALCHSLGAVVSRIWISSPQTQHQYFERSAPMSTFGGFCLWPADLYLSTLRGANPSVT